MKLKGLRIRMMKSALQEIKPIGWISIAIVILISIVIIFIGTGGYDSSAERPDVFDPIVNPLIE